MMHRAQDALTHKMGRLPKESSLIEDALKEYLAKFELPLPQDTITALSQLFKIDCQLTSLADDTLIELNGDGTTDLIETDTMGAPPITTPLPHPPAGTSALVAAA